MQGRAGRIDEFAVQAVGEESAGRGRAAAAVRIVANPVRSAARFPGRPVLRVQSRQWTPAARSASAAPWVAFRQGLAENQRTEMPPIAHMGAMMRSSGLADVG